MMHEVNPHIFIHRILNRKRKATPRAEKRKQGERRAELLAGKGLSQLFGFQVKVLMTAGILLL